jgi:hypothetical protein
MGCRVLLVADAYCGIEIKQAVNRVGASAARIDTIAPHPIQFLNDTCRGSSVVERRPEKAGVASSILAPGTIGMRQLFFTKEIYFAMSKIRLFPVLVRCF